MRRFEQNRPSIFDVLEEKSPEPKGSPPRPTTRRPPMLRPPTRRPRMLRPTRATRRALAWWTAAVLTLAGVSGLSLLWHAQESSSHGSGANLPLQAVDEGNHLA